MMLLLFTFNSHALAQNIALTDRFEIIDIMNSYARALDTKDYSLLRSIFAIDVEVMIVFDSDSPDG